VVPFGFGVAGEHCPFAGLQVPTSLHWSPPVQTTGFAPVQVPAWQVSVWVQALVSLQVVPLGFGVAGEHCPFAGLQVPASLHWSPVQTTGFAPVQVPAWQVSVWVQALVSLQVVPLGFGVAGEHCPFAGLQMPTSLHWSPPVQTTGFAPVQVPAWQVSVWVQPLLSLQVVPSGFAGFEHTPVVG
jgi:hypothetical protein